MPRTARPSPETATNDIYQTYVVVTTPNGSSVSHKARILPLYEGAIVFDDNGVIPAPPGEEAAPAATEYDYVPTPTITSISTSGGPASLASENGDSVVTITGKGFNVAALEWINFGDPTPASSQQFFNLVSVTGTKIEILAPGLENFSVNPESVPVRRQDARGPSRTGRTRCTPAFPDLQRAGDSGPDRRHECRACHGWHADRHQGHWISNQVLAVTFNDVATPFSFGTQYNFTANSNTDLTTKTVSQNPAVVDMQLCTVTDCSLPTPSTTTARTSSSSSRRAIRRSTRSRRTRGSGGTQVTITGENLGCVREFLRQRSCKKFRPTRPSFMRVDDQITVTAPPGTRPGKSVKVTLTTVESDITGFGPTTDAVHFMYNAAAGPDADGLEAGTGSGRSRARRAESTAERRAPRVRVRDVRDPHGDRRHRLTFGGWSGSGCWGTGTCSVYDGRSESGDGVVHC